MGIIHVVPLCATRVFLLGLQIVDTTKEKNKRKPLNSQRWQEWNNKKGSHPITPHLSSPAPSILLQLV